MNFNLFVLGGYGLFVWPAFIFTFAVCFSLYTKTRKELQKQEMLYLNKFKHSHVVNINKIKQKKSLKEATVASNF
tara:strand:- start:351 stop:575 length:225 start_codon:yes stop_codon:yes gene_type:complete